jgi:tetratricopeptide (TPR) repeat protein
MDELRILKNSVGDYISINKFILANCSRKPVELCLNKFSITNDLVKIVFEIDADPQIDQSKPFANITPFNYLPQEQQVLFMLGSLFQIMDIQNDKKSGLWNVKIVLSNLKKEYDETNLIACGYLLQDMGQLHDAEKYFIRLLKEVPPNQEDFFQCYDSLGFLTFIRTNYESSLQWYQKLIQILPYDHPYLPHSFYSIGCVYQKLLNFNQAIEYYDKAIQIWQEIPGDDEPREMAECLNNMGCIYETQKYYSTALDSHKKSLAIRDKQQMDMSSSYNNIANIFLCLGAYESALENYMNSLEAKKKSPLTDDLSLATTLENIALVYEEDGNYQESLTYYKKAAAIFQKLYPSTHTSNIQIQKHISSLQTLV